MVKTMEYRIEKRELVFGKIRCKGRKCKLGSGSVFRGFDFVLPFLILLASTATSHAMDRYYCAVDDAQLKLSVVSGFEEGPDWPLRTLRGIVIFKPGQGKTLEGTLKIDEDDVVQSKREDTSMRIESSSDSGVDTTATHVQLTLDTKQEKGDINHFLGTYKIVVQPLGENGAASALTRVGKLSCARL